MEELLKQLLSEIGSIKENMATKDDIQEVKSDIARIETKLDKLAENQQEDVVALLETLSNEIDQVADETNKILRRHELDIQLLKKIAAQ